MPEGTKQDVYAVPEHAMNSQKTSKSALECISLRSMHTTALAAAIHRNWQSQVADNVDAPVMMQSIYCCMSMKPAPCSYHLTACC